MRQLFVAVLAVLLVNGLFASMAFADGFPDVTEGNRFNEEITYLVDEGVISGFTDGTFRPKSDVTRGQAAIMIGRALGFSGARQDTAFPDVDKSVTASGYVAALTAEGIISGYPDGTYRPGDVVTRAEMAIFLHRAFVEDDVGGFEYFMDVGPGMHAYEAIADLHALGIASGYLDGAFRPTVELNREQFAAFLARAVNPAVFADKPETPADMTLNEKIGQMVIAGLEGTSLQAADQRLITDYHVAGFIFYGDNLVTPEQTRRFVGQVKAANKPGNLPLFISVDQEGGRVSRLPEVNITPSSAVIGDRNDPAYAYEIGRTLGRQLKSMDFNLNYAPVLDINSNPDNPVIGDRSFGNTAGVVSRMGIQVMKGMQTENVIPVIKHFPGHGDTSVDSHVELPIVPKTLAELRQLELIPFSNAIDSGADVTMVAHILLPEIDGTYPSSMSERVITGILRNELGFGGVVMTDDMTMGAIADHYGIGEAAVRSVQAGSDVILVAHGDENVIEAIKAIRAAVLDGRIPEWRIDESVQRIAELKDEYF
ncbi:glycoside hydrolase family 3 N-terminal domain-containing protein [Indiicoccus explosivorum]|uniref:glycoside hydrolase family 3 N-terminal domain-containing protein n=1 Tax=Indiicoccus explosivorum TaxID=1917864 RepID=UPI000B447DA2|nr:glycoside hydrolase family 3 N-terminal domain-containing protein [Indiicoccus explosivorum]